MSKDFAIRVEGLSKAYRIGLKEEIPDTFAGAAASWLKAPLRNLRRLCRLNTFQESNVLRAESGEPDGNVKPSALSSPLSASSDTIWALRDVSFSVAPGEVVGIGPARITWLGTS